MLTGSVRAIIWKQALYNSIAVLVVWSLLVFLFLGDHFSAAATGAAFIAVLLRSFPARNERTYVTVYGFVAHYIRKGVQPELLEYIDSFGTGLFMPICTLQASLLVFLTTMNIVLHNWWTSNSPLIVFMVFMMGLCIPKPTLFASVFLRIIWSWRRTPCIDLPPMDEHLLDS